MAPQDDGVTVWNRQTQPISRLQLPGLSNSFAECGAWPVHLPTSSTHFVFGSHSET